MRRYGVILGVLTACGDGGGGSPASPDGADADSTDGAMAADVPDAPGCPAAPRLVRGATRKVCQTTGDEDRELGVATANATLARYGLWGTDLGASFSHGGKTWFLFGDSIPSDDCGDALAFSTDADASDCLALDFVTGEGGGYRSPIVPGVALGCYEVPLDGVSAGGAMYVWFSTAGMTRSILARSNDDGATFGFVHDLSDARFVNVSASIDGDRLLLFGSGTYRESEVFLASAPVAAIEDRGALAFFGGFEADGCTPRFTADEAQAAPLFGPACVGELSVHRDAVLGVWVALYNCGEPRGIHARAARDPWGPWSEPVVVFDPWADQGYCHFMHTSHEDMVCDQVHDPGRENEWGGEYGAYAIEGATEPTATGAALYYLLSTWNPYNTMLMRSELELAD
jgi:hypothetical protein